MVSAVMERLAKLTKKAHYDSVAKSSASNPDDKTIMERLDKLNAGEYDLKGFGFDSRGRQRPSLFDHNPTGGSRTAHKVDPRNHSNLGDNGCPKTGPQIAKGLNGCPIAYAKREGRNQATGLAQRLDKERKVDAKRSGSLKHGLAYQQAANPNSSHVAALKSVRSSADAPETPAPVADTTPVTAPAPEAPKLETPAPEIQTASGGGVFWLFSSFLFIGLIGAALYWWYQRRFGGKRRKPTRKPRQWEMVRMQSIQNRTSMGHSHYRPSTSASPRAMEAGRSSQCRYRTTSAACRSPINGSMAAPPMVRSPSMGSYVEVPRASHEPSAWERVSKGGKLS